MELLQSARLTCTDEAPDQPPAPAMLVKVIAARPRIEAMPADKIVGEARNRPDPRAHDFDEIRRRTGGHGSPCEVGQAIEQGIVDAANTRRGQRGGDACFQDLRASPIRSYACPELGLNTTSPATHVFRASAREGSLPMASTRCRYNFVEIIFAESSDHRIMLVSEGIFGAMNSSKKLRTRRSLEPWARRPQDNMTNVAASAIRVCRRR